MSDRSDEQARTRVYTGLAINGLAGVAIAWTFQARGFHTDAAGILLRWTKIA